MSALLNGKDEDSASKALVEVLREDSSALRDFLAFAAPEFLDLSGRWDIRSQHPTASGRSIDIFLRNGNASIVVEVKVRDVIKAYQFDPYVRHVLEHETGTMPRLVWLVQNPRAVIGELASQATMLIWWDLTKRFLALTSPLPQRLGKALLECGIAVEPKRKKNQHLGYLPEHATRILNAVKAGFANLEGGVEENTRTPLSLHVGRTSWDLYWRTRVWFYLRPLTDLPNAVGPFGFICHVILYNSGLDAFDSRRIENWSRILDRAGFSFQRNQHGKWSRQQAITAPITLHSKAGLHYVFAEHKDGIKSNFEWQNDAAAIEAGRHYLGWALSIADSCAA